MDNKLQEKVPMTEALIALTRLMDTIDEGGEIDEAIQKDFNVVAGNFTSSVARRVCVLQSIPGLIKRSKEMRDEWAKKAKSLAAIEKKLEENTMQLMVAFPEMVFKCDAGEFRIQKNPGPSLETALNLGSTTIQHVLSNEDVEKIPKEFVDVKSYYTLVTTKLKEELLKGKEFSWASLNFGQNLRIRK
jgi:hypothetical protein